MEVDGGTDGVAGRNGSSNGMIYMHREAGAETGST